MGFAALLLTQTLYVGAPASADTPLCYTVELRPALQAVSELRPGLEMTTTLRVGCS